MAANWCDHFSILGIVYVIKYSFELADCFTHIKSPTSIDHEVYHSFCVASAMELRTQDFTIGQLKT